MNIADVAEHLLVGSLAVAAADGIDDALVKIDHVTFDVAVDVDPRERFQRQVGE